MNSCLTSVLPFPEHHVTSTINTSGLAIFSGWASFFLFILQHSSPGRKVSACFWYGFRVFFIIITMVTMKIGKIGLPQLFESHEKKSYFKWWMHLFLSLNKHSLLYGSFLFCYRYLVSGTISNYETLICSMYVSMWFIYCMNMFCSIFFLRFEIDWNCQTYNSEICIWLTKDWWGNFRPTIYRLSKTLFVCLFLWRGRY